MALKEDLAKDAARHEQEMGEVKRELAEQQALVKQLLEQPPVV